MHILLYIHPGITDSMPLIPWMHVGCQDEDRFSYGQK